MRILPRRALVLVFILYQATAEAHLQSRKKREARVLKSEVAVSHTEKEKGNISADAYTLNLLTNVKIPKPKLLKILKKLNSKNAANLEKLNGTMVEKNKVLGTHLKHFHNLIKKLKINAKRFNKLKNHTVRISTLLKNVAKKAGKNAKNINYQKLNFSKEIEELDHLEKQLKTNITENDIFLRKEQDKIDALNKTLLGEIGFTGDINDVVKALNHSFVGENHKVDGKLSTLKNLTHAIEKELNHDELMEHARAVANNKSIDVLNNWFKKQAEELMLDEKKIKKDEKHLNDLGEEMTDDEKKIKHLNRLQNNTRKVLGHNVGKLQRQINFLFNKTNLHDKLLAAHAKNLVELSKPKKCSRGWSYHADICYKLVTCSQGHRCDWQDARTYCNERAGRIARIQSAAANSFLVKHVPKASVKWIMIGGMDRDNEGTWVYRNGRLLTYHNWANKGEAEVNSRNRNCIRINTANGKWHDAVCSFRHGNTYAFACERHSD